MIAEPRTACCERPLLCHIGEHAEINERTLLQAACVHKHQVRQLVPLLDRDGVFPCMAYQGCARNEFVALNERHCKELPTPDDHAQSIWSHAFDFLRAECPLQTFRRPLSENEVIVSSPQSRRARIRNAFDNIHKNGWSDSYAKVKCFTKFETFPDEFGDKEFRKSARLIQHRSDEYCYTLARYLKRVEWRVLYKVARGRHSGHRLFAKGMTPNMKAQWLDGAWDEFPNPVAVLMDHSSYDAHLTNAIRCWERRFYCQYYPGDKRLKHLLDLQRIQKGKTANGIRYKVHGTMCSGDYNTSLGDNIINAAIILYAFRNVRCRILADGDDSVVIVDKSDLDLVDTDAFRQVGLSTKIDYAYEKSQVEFCQSKPIQTSVGPKYVRNPNRIWSKTAYTCKSYSGKAWFGLLKAVGMSELACNRGVPVLQAYAEMLIRSAGNVRALAHELAEMLAHKHVEYNFNPAVVSEQARRDFEEAFGITTTEQLWLEDCFKKRSLPCLPAGLNVWG